MDYRRRLYRTIAILGLFLAVAAYPAVKVQWARKVITDFCDRVSVASHIGPIETEARGAGYDVLTHRTTRPLHKKLIVAAGWFGAQCRCEVIYREDRVVSKQLFVGN